MSPVFESGKREKAQQKGEDYKEAVVEYMESEGYMLVEDSNIHGALTDLVFKHKATGEEIHVESKGSKESPNSMLSHIAEYFLIYANRRKGDRPDIYIFLEKLGNRSLWLNIFDRNPDGDKISEFYEEKIRDIDDRDLNDEVSNTTEEDFKDFAINTYVYERDYLQLRREAEQNEKSQKFNYEPYLKSYSPIREESDLQTNVFKITQYPEVLYSVDIRDRNLGIYDYDFTDYRPVSTHEGMLYTLREPTSLHEEILNEIDQSNISKLDFAEWINSREGKDGSVNVIKELLRKLAASIGHENDCRVMYRKGSSIVYPKLDKETHGEERKMKGIWMAKSLESYEEVRHRAVRIQVKKFGEGFYYVFSPTQEFTHDGVHTVSGSRKKELQDVFSPNRYPEQNLKKLREVRTWKSVLMPGETLSQFSAGRDTPMVQMRIEQVSNLSLNVRPPRDSKERDEIVTGDLT